MVARPFSFGEQETEQAMAEMDWAGGLKPQYDYMLTEKPDDPEMRESASLWFYDESGEIGLPRIGIEAQGAVWDQHRFDANVVFADGRVLRESRRGESKPAIGPDGKPSILAVDGLEFRVVEPFRKWVVSYDGEATDSTTELMIRDKFDTGKRVAVRFEVAIEMAAPAWVQDNTPEKLATMTEQERIDAGLMGYGFRKEQLCRGEGWFEVAGQRRALKGTGLRIHRQSVRPMGAFRGHCWQSAIFPDGRGFGYIAYPPVPGEDPAKTYNEGYVYQDGQWYPARATKIPFLRDLMVAGDDVSLELESELGTTRIEGASALNTIRVGNPDTMGLTLNQGGAKYTWDGQSAYGMIERSSLVENTRVAL
jgi:prepilin-type processing-associated H-X9-DG protein